MNRAPEYDNDWSDPPLMNRPVLMVMALRLAAKGETSLEGFANHVRRLRDRMGDPVRVTPEVLEARLAIAIEYLARAGLLDQRDQTHFLITDRGRAVLSDHPAGVDNSVLSEFPEFRTFVRERVAQRSDAVQAQSPIPHPVPSPAFHEGFRAFGDGIHVSENPYEQETISHLAWANGWFEARDEAQEHRR